MQYTICDMILFFQIYYYRIVHHSLRDTTDSIPGPSRPSDSSETSPLIISPPSDDSKRHHNAPRASLRRGLIKYALLALFVVGVGFAALIYDEVQARRPNRGSRAPPSSGKDVYEWRSQIFGWVSAVMYLGSRVPQISSYCSTRPHGTHSRMICLYSQKYANEMRRPLPCALPLRYRGQCDVCPEHTRCIGGVESYSDQCELARWEWANDIFGCTCEFRLGLTPPLQRAEFATGDGSVCILQETG